MPSSHGYGKPTAGDGSLHIGLVFDRKIAFGGGIDFLWNVNKKATPIAGNTYKIEESQKTFMFPISGYLALSPIPQFRFHPCLSTQIGFNTMYYSNKQDTLQDDESVPGSDENGWYMGFYWKIAGDVMFNLGETSVLFAGLEYQVTRPDKVNVRNDDIFTQRDMNGAGFRFGVRLAY
ncbi:MAG: hypothetical protein JW863_12705 [Chitinispirillaceae bacterium]|nr:hypothetical protein [Chitinispirillaceae bacterium]